MSIRCRYCNTLIIHRFNHNYNRMDNKRKQQHERACQNNPKNIQWDMVKSARKAIRLKRYINEQT